MKTLLKMQIIRARDLKMTPEQKREQAISFAYGNMKLHNPKITRAQVEEQYDKLAPFWVK